jgi:hypothetical protein
MWKIESRECICTLYTCGIGRLQIIQGHPGTVQQRFSSRLELPGLLYLYFSLVGHFPNKRALVRLESLLMKTGFEGKNLSLCVKFGFPFFSSVVLFPASLFYSVCCNLNLSTRKNTR